MGSSRVNLGRARHQLHCSWGRVAGGVRDPRLGAYSPPQRCRGGAALHTHGHPPTPFITPGPRVPGHPRGAHPAARTVLHAQGCCPSRRCPHGIAQTCVPMPPLQTCRHTHRDTGRGPTRAHTCTPRCAHAACTAAAKAASHTGTAAPAQQQLRRTTPTRRTPTQTAFLSPSYHTDRQTN